MNVWLRVLLSLAGAWVLLGVAWSVLSAVLFSRAAWRRFPGEGHWLSDVPAAAAANLWTSVRRGPFAWQIVRRPESGNSVEIEISVDGDDREEAAAVARAMIEAAARVVEERRRCRGEGDDGEA